MQLRTVETPQLGDRSYLVHDGSVGVVVDPQRDIDRIEAEIREAGIRVTHVLETHLHNDYVSGGLELARRTGAEYVLAAGDQVAFERRAVTDGDVIETGTLRIGVVATPGHTVNHVAYVVEPTSSTGSTERRGGERATHEPTSATDSTEQGGAAPAVFTGGSLLYGSVGRTDLVDPALTERLAHMQYRSARRLAGLLPGEATVLPTHGFGSFCSAGPATAHQVSTMADEKLANDALTTDDEDRFVERLMAGLAAYPRYYAHMAPLNQRGSGAPDLSPPVPVDRNELRRRLQAGEWVVDLRDRKAFAARHLVRSLSFELSRQFTTYVGWVLPWGDPITLVGDTPEQVAEAQRALARIGIDKGTIQGAAVDPLGGAGGNGLVTSFPSVGWAELAETVANGEHPVVLDVRREAEYAEGHVEGAVNVPLHDLLDRLDDVPAGPLWVHCASGYRAAVAASILERDGRDVVHIDDDWDPATVGKAGLPVVP